MRQKHEQGLLVSIEFLKSLVDLARDVVHAERTVEPATSEAGGKAALTELFEDARNDSTLIMVERVVSDIDEIVRHVRFEGWQTIHAGEREVKKALGKTLFKYHLHHDRELFDRAYYGYTFGSTTEALERDRPVTAKPRPVQVRVALAQLGGHSWAGPRGHAPVPTGVPASARRRRRRWSR